MQQLDPNGIGNLKSYQPLLTLPREMLKMKDISGKILRIIPIKVYIVIFTLLSQIL